jgi:hypothetical protein
MIVSSFTSDRRFSVFSYQMSHGTLLLRSGKTSVHHTRIDVLVKDVRALEIRCWFEGIEIREAQQDYLRDFRSNPIEMIEVESRVYALKGEGWQGFIVGGTLSVQEDDGELMEPSSLFAPWPPGNPAV